VHIPLFFRLCYALIITAFPVASGKRLSCALHPLRMPTIGSLPVAGLPRRFLG